MNTYKSFLFQKLFFLILLTISLPTITMLTLPKEDSFYTKESYLKNKFFYEEHMRIAAATGNDETFKRLIIMPININAQCYHFKQTPLHLAVLRNSKFMVKMLLKHEAEVNIQNCQGNTPLHYAIHQQNEDLTILLLNAGADPTIKNNYNEQPNDYLMIYYKQHSFTPSGFSIHAHLLCNSLAKVIKDNPTLNNT